MARMPWSTRGVLILVGLFVLGGMVSALARGAQPISTVNGVFSEAQATRGEDAYYGRCAGCHGDDLISVDAETPSLTGPRFKAQWVGKTLAELFELIRTTMPSTGPGTLDDQTNIDIVAFILGFNGYQAGGQELAADSGALEAITIEPLEDR